MNDDSAVRYFSKFLDTAKEIVEYVEADLGIDLKYHVNKSI